MTKIITAELEQAAALRYLYGWLQHHPKYGTLAKPELSDSLYYADVSIMLFLYILLLPSITNLEIFGNLLLENVPNCSLLL